MDEILHQKKRAPRARPPGGDRETVDLFTGEPFGAPPPPRKLSANGLAMLEYLVAHGPLREEGLRSVPPPALFKVGVGNTLIGVVGGALEELRRAGMTQHHMPEGVPFPSKSDLLLAVSDAGTDYLRRQRMDAKEPAKKREKPNPAQRSILDAEKTKQDADEGIARSESKDPEWRKWALARVRIVCKRNQLFIMDDVWDDIGRQPRSRSEGSAMGSVMREAARRGWCRATKDFRRSTRPGTNQKPLPVWKSLIFDPPATR